MNKRIKIGACLLIICVLMLILIPITVSEFSYLISNTVVTEQYNVKKGEGIVESYGYDMKQDCKGISLNIKSQLNEGEVTFKLLDPAGNIQWEGTIKSGEEFNQTKSFGKIVGYWSLDFENVHKAAEGEFQFVFKKDA